MTPSTRTTPTTTPTKRSTEMYLINQDMARSQIGPRLGEALDLRPGRGSRVRRVTRRTGRAAQQARLALARSL